MEKQQTINMRDIQANLDEQGIILKLQRVSGTYICRADKEGIPVAYKASKNLITAVTECLDRLP